MSNELPPDPNADLDGVVQAGVVALVFRARKSGMTRDQLIEVVTRTWEVAERHEPRIRSILDFGADLFSQVKNEAARQRGEGGGGSK